MTSMCVIFILLAARKAGVQSWQLCHGRLALSISFQSHFPAQMDGHGRSSTSPHPTLDSRSTVSVARHFTRQTVSTSEQSDHPFSLACLPRPVKPHRLTFSRDLARQLPLSGISHTRPLFFPAMCPSCDWFPDVSSVPACSWAICPLRASSSVSKVHRVSRRGRKHVEDVVE